MNYFSTISFLLVLTIRINAQEIAKEYPDSTKNRIRREVEQEAKVFRKNLNTEYLTNEAIEFSVDTFKIWLTNSKRQIYDCSTEGMNNSVKEMTASYDKLMNKYYQLLLKMLDPNDREIIIEAQKSWIRFRDAETKLIWNMTQDKYCSGGTIQTNFATGNCSDLTIRRTEQIFYYYNSTIEGKNKD